MSATRKRRMTAAGLVAASAMLVVALGGSAAGQSKSKSVDVVKSLSFSTVTASTPAPAQPGAQNNDGIYVVLTASAQCPAGSTPVAGNAYFSTANSATAPLDGDELLLAGVKKVGTGYTAEGLTDLDITTPYNLVVEVTCATTAAAKVAKPVKPKKKKKTGAK